MTVEIHGFCGKRFQPPKDAFAANSTTASRSARRLPRRDATRHGRLVVDLSAGDAAADHTRAWG